MSYDPNYFHKDALNNFLEELLFMTRSHRELQFRNSIFNATLMLPVYKVRAVNYNRP